LRAIVIDNEKSSLNQLKKLAGTNDNINLIASFTDSLEGLLNVAKLKPNVVFIDIDMPETNGIYMAEQIIKSYPDTCIVFVASHDDYALKAFELNALDYLLKPVTRERFCQCVEKLLKYGGGNIDARSFHDLNYHFNESSKKLFIEFEGETILIKPEDIYYFEVKDKTVIIKTKINTYKNQKGQSLLIFPFDFQHKCYAKAPEILTPYPCTWAAVEMVTDDLFIDA
jgi:DNA-binding LytR/AlgR family response regulator